MRELGPQIRRRRTLVFSLLVFFTGCRARQPGAWETALARQIKQKVTVGGKGEINPLPTTEENIHAGRRNFSSYCMVCHGLDGQKHRRPVCRENVSTGAAAHFACSAGLQRWAAAMGDRQRNLPDRHAGVQGYTSDERFGKSWFTFAISRPGEVWANQRSMAESQSRPSATVPEAGPRHSKQSSPRMLLHGVAEYFRIVRAQECCRRWVFMMYCPVSKALLRGEWRDPHPPQHGQR